MGLILNINDLFPLPFASIVFPPMNDVGAKRRPTKAMRAIRVMVKFDFQWHKTILAKVEALNGFSLFKIPEMQLAPIF